MPIPAGARWVRLEELERGLELDTGHRHVLVLPIPTLALTGPTEKTLYITHPPEQDYAPLMPLLEGVRVQVKGIIGDPTPQTDFTWRLVLDYTTRAKPENQRETQVVWELTSRGGRLPPDVFRRTKGKITRSRFVQLREEDRKAAARAKQQPLRETAAAGGDLTIEVRATIGGQKVSAPPLSGNHILAQGNPSSAAVQKVLAEAASAEEAYWLTRILCVETDNLHFRVRDNHARYSYAGEPVMNGTGDGGVGIAQVTNPRPGPAEMWDWRANVVRGIRIYRDKGDAVDDYVRNIRALVDSPPGTAEGDIVRQVRIWRHSRGLPPLARIIVPDLTDEQFRDDRIRGFNGYPNPVHRRGQLGLPWHEFRLKLEGSPARLALQNEQVLKGAVVAEAIWERVPLEDRAALRNSKGKPVGKPDYVGEVKTKVCR